ncbi:MAG: hypothetical protein K2O12_02525, partial [Muribaculaceae bacterium]|nr:hypothetical protein [Muribaculaceae bacterium]
AMGGVGYAMNSGRQINVMNPASYANCDTLTFLFDIGMDYTSLWSREGNESGTSSSGGLQYITMQVPLTKYLGASLGLLPYSSVGYAFGGTIDNGADAREGSGGLNQLYIGIAGKLFKGFSVGANIAYLWGDATNSAYAYTQSGATSLFQHVISVRDWHLDLGVQYTFPISAKNELSVGAKFSPGKDLRGTSYGIVYDINQDTQPDTTDRAGLKNHYSLPDTWGVGISYRWNRRLLAEIDFTYQNWESAKFLSLEGWDRTQFSDRWKVAVGAEYQPNPRGGYLSRITYRLGAYYNHDYVKVKGNTLGDYGVSCGFGFPVPGFKTIVNLGFDYRYRRAHPDPLIKEQYFNITLGVNFNELWFWRNKLR